ncbi:hypothetical protein [Zooshikella sp. RANM57]|uniref:hypothetical protein n=1 Tax=Zooshikella sp. RANM57 TaxID=3425863 RepID=UPI003D6F3A03
MATREDIQKNWEVIKAFKDGKTIQFYINVTNEWEDIKDPSFDAHHKYRVKPETFALGDILEVKGRAILFEKDFYRVTQTSPVTYNLVNMRTYKRLIPIGVRAPSFYGDPKHVPVDILVDDYMKYTFKKVTYEDFIKAEAEKMKTAWVKDEFSKAMHNQRPLPHFLGINAFSTNRTSILQDPFA